MRTHPLARRYARALFGLAQETDKTGPVLEELKSFTAFLQQNRRIKAFLMSPEVEKKPKQAVVQELLENRATPLFSHFIQLLVEKGRQDYLGQIVAAYGELYDQSIGRVRAQVYSAVPLEAAQMEQIRQEVARYLKAEVLLENRVDAAILGGVIIQFAGVVIDGSLRHQLNQLRQELRQVKTAAL
ncbi:MAG TPA: ATP synthase F1 subunit delta [bacterium]|nr:ATP synthase F1 subunit delta [bacterium]HQG46865.1 ATP synthase F1 subunit delta [bacterium]HQI49254.1 ATP synthase F1 subunit delta [bacterium]HQJ63578.1 ATP synthase F1 subunit delta [bacterium]